MTDLNIFMTECNHHIELHCTAKNKYRNCFRGMCCCICPSNNFCEVSCSLMNDYIRGGDNNDKSDGEV